MIEAVQQLGAALPVSPYVGLVPYREEDAAFFFGRDEERAIVVGNLRASRLTILYGASGVGKTSLLRAGAIPDLRERIHAQAVNGGHRAALAVCLHSNWREEPLPAVLDAIRTGAEQALGGEALRDADPGEPPVEMLRRWTTRVRTLLVVLDQFEDYFLYHPDEDGPGTFADEFPRIVNDPTLRVNVLLSLREDAWAKLDRFEGRIPRLFANYIRVEHLTRAAGRDAIRHPVAEWNRRLADSDAAYDVEDELVEAVLDAAAGGRLALTERDAGAGDSVEAPFLQLVMERLWRATVDAGDHHLTLARLHELGGAERIVENHLHEAVGALTPEERLLAAELFRFLVTRARTKIAHAPSDLAEWTGHPESEVAAVCEKLCRGEAGRILRAVPPPTPGEPTRYELFHDVLAEPVVDWRQGFEHARAQRAALRRSARIVGALVALLAVFAVAFLLVLKASHDASAARTRAEHEARSAESLALAETARAELRGHLDVALLVGLEAYLAQDSTNTRNSLLSALQLAAGTESVHILHGHTDGVRSVAFSPTEPLLASTGDDSVRLWDTKGSRPLAVLRGSPGVVNAVAFSPDGSTLATGGDDGTLRLWDVAQSPRLSTQMPMGRPIWSVAFSPDGRTVAVGTRKRLWLLDLPNGRRAVMEMPDRVDAIAFRRGGATLAVGGQSGPDVYGILSGWAQLVDRSDPRKPAPAIRTGSPVSGVAFSPDGAVVAVATDSRVRLSRSRDLRAATGLIKRADSSGGVAFTPDGRKLATAGGDGNVQVWDARSLKRLGLPRRNGGGLDAIAFSPDGRMLAAGADDGTVRLWDPAVRRPFPQPVPTNPPVMSATFAPDGKTIATAKLGGVVQLYDAQSGEPGRKRHVGYQSSALAYSPDGGTLAAGRPHSVVLLDSRSLAVRERLRVPRHPAPCNLGPRQLPAPCEVRSLAFSPRGDLLAIGGANGYVDVWDLRKSRRLGAIAAHKGVVPSLVFSPDGSTVYSGGYDGVVSMFKARTFERLGRLPTRGAPRIYGIALNRAGTLLAAPGPAGSFGLWDPRTRRPIGSLKAPDAFGAKTVALTPDGKTLVTSDVNGALLLWNVADRRPIGQRLSMPTGARTLAFSHDGRSLVAAQGLPFGFAVFRIWHDLLWTGRDDVRDRVCNLVVGRLSREEWRSLAPNSPYRSSCPR